MKKLLIILTAIVSFILFSGTSGCEHKSPAAATELECVPGAVSFKTVVQSKPGIPRVLPTEKQNLVITNQADYETYCGVDFAGQNPVDFNSKTAILAEMGFTVDACNYNEVVNITTDCASITVTVDESCCMPCIMMVVNNDPMHLITIDKTDLPINFVYLEDDCQCGNIGVGFRVPNP